MPSCCFSSCRRFRRFLHVSFWNRRHFWSCRSALNRMKVFSILVSNHFLILKMVCADLLMILLKPLWMILLKLLFCRRNSWKNYSWALYRRSRDFCEKNYALLCRNTRHLCLTLYFSSSQQKLKTSPLRQFNTNIFCHKKMEYTTPKFPAKKCVFKPLEASIRIFIHKSVTYGTKHDLKVKSHAPVLNIVDIVVDSFPD